MPSAQSRPDCHPSRFPSSRMRKLNTAATWDWQYIIRRLSASWVAWSGAGLSSGGFAWGAGGPTSGTEPGQLSTPVYAPCFAESICVW